MQVGHHHQPLTTGCHLLLCSPAKVCTVPSAVLVSPITDLLRYVLERLSHACSLHCTPTPTPLPPDSLYHFGFVAHPLKVCFATSSSLSLQSQNSRMFFQKAQHQVQKPGLKVHSSQARKSTLFLKTNTPSIAMWHIDRHSFFFHQLFNGEQHRSLLYVDGVASNDIASNDIQWKEGFC